jgi:hypothetical protein
MVQGTGVRIFYIPKKFTSFNGKDQLLSFYQIESQAKTHRAREVRKTSLSEISSNRASLGERS